MIQDGKPIRPEQVTYGQDVPPRVPYKPIVVGYW